MLWHFCGLSMPCGTLQNTIYNPMWITLSSSWRCYNYLARGNVQHFISHCDDPALESANTPFTQELRPLCLPCATTKLARSPLKAEGKPNGCRGRSRVAHRTFRHRHGRHGRHEVLGMFKTVAQRSPRRSVAHRSLKGGRMKAHTSPWSQNGCTVVGHWSPSKKCEHCVSIWATRLPSLYHHCASFGRPMASIERSLWRPLCLHSATTATLEPPWQWFCLHSAFFARPVVPLQQLWSFKEGTRVVLQQLYRNRTFWVPAITERPNHFYGRTKVARRSQPCVHGALGICRHRQRYWSVGPLLDW